MVGQAQYCWNGTDDFIARRNMTCKTGEASMMSFITIWILAFCLYKKSKEVDQL